MAASGKFDLIAAKSGCGRGNEHAKATAESDRGRNDMHGIAMVKTHFIELFEEMQNHFCGKAETMKTTCCQTGLDKGEKMPHRLKTALSCKIGKVGAAVFALTAVFFPYVW